MFHRHNYQKAEQLANRLISISRLENVKPSTDISETLPRETKISADISVTHPGRVKDYNAYTNYSICIAQKHNIAITFYDSASFAQSLLESHKPHSTCHTVLTNSIHQI